ncbi:nucleoside deaminase [Lacticaseibacillus daqingensis]|uniref:nucleoside deaminase n=1 Tax=Lacticaseibacillus daqingensis TaxID=2486014 RepID=UPI000F77425C|nr:nucleoside deaminase [Lacticaseibacillus daqingensis]
MYQREFMQQAIDQAALNLTTNEGGPFGCVIVQNGQVLARAHNRVLASHDATAHGEVEAIRAAGAALNTHDLTGCELYTSAMPCPMCLSAIIWANIKVVYYGNSADDAAAIGFRDAAIYDFIDHGLQGDTLTLSQHDRALSLPTFEAYQAQNKQLY